MAPSLWLAAMMISAVSDAATAAVASSRVSSERRFRREEKISPSPP
ncbi:MAG: hypothetical protein ACLQBB_11460 [Solirubrobacteraceae bacterium]